MFSVAWYKIESRKELLQTSIVYVLHKGDHDVSEAECHGTLKAVFEGVVPVFRTDSLECTVIQELSAFTEDDFILISGPALLCMITTAVLLRRFESFKALVYNAKTAKYVVRQIYR